jgi:hypothetical protein
MAPSYQMALLVVNEIFESILFLYIIPQSAIRNPQSAFRIPQCFSLFLLTSRLAFHKLLEKFKKNVRYAEEKK